MRTIALAALVSLACLASACDGRTDQTACLQYANRLAALECDDSADAAFSTFCEESTSPCADTESSECVPFWDCLMERATCDVEARFEGNQTCALAADLELQEDIFYDDQLNE